MSRTGYLIEVYMDANPYSETYGQERTERILDTEECKTQQPANYVHVYTYCEMNPNGSYTGNCVKVYEDVEPLSPTYGQQMEQISTDQVLCPPDSPDADWQQEGESYCEQIAYQPSGRLGNSGNIVTVYRDVNEYSPTYNTTREVKEQDLTNCPIPSTTPVWVIISETCHLVNGLKDGTKDVVRVDTNPYSPYYNDGQSETINVTDTVMCPPDSTAPEWTETSYACEQSDGYNTGYTIITEEDTNSHSSTYGQTRTRRVSDDVRCPVQTPDTMSWRIINNRGVSTDTITSITINFNTNAFSITASGSLAPGGQINGSSVIPANLKSTALSCTSVTLSPNTSLPTLYQYSQTPSAYTWNTDHSSTLIITLWDGDGTGPEWTEQSYVCNTVSGFRDGSSTVTEEDTNPNSGTYGQTRTRTIQNDSRCPVQTEANWVESSYSCQQESGHNTGDSISVQTDTNPMSPTYNTTRTIIIANDSRCPTTSTPDWVEVSYTCQQQSGHNTGVIEITERDVNPGSPTYDTTRTRTATGDPRCVRDENPDWVEVSYICEQADTTADWAEVSRTCQKDGNNENTGYATVVETDMNPYSSTAGQTRTRTVQDLTNCPLPHHDTTPNWVEQSRTCQKDGNNENTGYAIITEIDTNPYSSTYNTTRTRTVQDLTNCPVNTSPNWVEQSRTCEKDGNNENTGNAIVTEIDTNPYSSTYNTTRTRTVQDLTNCPLPTPSANYKLRYTTSSGSGEIACDGDTTLTASNTNSTKDSYLTAELGDCATSIGYGAFFQASNMTSITIPSGVTSIDNYAFIECTSLTSISLPSTVTSINTTYQPFSTCPSLASITVDGNNSVYDSRNNCNAVIETSSNKLIIGCKNTVIPSTVTSIGVSAFAGATGLLSATLPSGLTTIENYAFSYCSGLTTLDVPNSVTTIGSRVFERCMGLTTVTIGTGVTSIGDNAFVNCRSLVSVTVNATTPPTLGTNAFRQTNECIIYVPAASLSAYQSASVWSDYSYRIQAIPNS